MSNLSDAAMRAYQRANKIINEYASGTSKAEIARNFKVSRPTVHSIIKKHENGESLFRKPYDSTMRFKLNDQDKVNIDEFCKANEHGNLTEMTSELRLTVSKPTLSRFLDANGYKFYKTKSKLALEPEEKKSRFRWACEREHWSEEDWKAVCFTDETTIRNYSNNYKPTSIERKSEHKNSLMPRRPSKKFKVINYLMYINVHKKQN